MTWILLIGGGLAVILLVVGVIDSANSERALVEQRLGRYLDEDKSTGSRDDSSLVTDWVNKRVEKSSYGDRIARELARADLKFMFIAFSMPIIVQSNPDIFEHRI